MRKIMEEIGFYEGPGYFSSDYADPADENSPFMVVTSLATGDLLRSPLERLVFCVCVKNNPAHVIRRAVYANLEDCLRHEKPEALPIMARVFDPLAGLDIREKGRKKLRKEQKEEERRRMQRTERQELLQRQKQSLRELSRLYSPEVIRCVAALG